MKRILMAALIASAVGLGSAPAYAAPPPTPTPTNDPCSYAVVTGAIACVGYYDKNLLQGGVGSSTSDLAPYITELLNGPATTSSPGYSPTYTIGSGTGTVLAALNNLSGTGTAGQPYTYNFAPFTMSGYTIFAAHFGNFPDSTYDSGPDTGKIATDVTAFWLLDLGSNTTSSVTINNGQGISNAQILGTGTPAVPEPATWALMLVGFGGIGMTLRRRRQPALAQIA